MFETPDQVFFHTIEYLIDFSLTEIKHPLNLIPEKPTSNYSDPNDFESDEEGFNSDCLAWESDDMEDKNDHNEERGNPPQNNQPRLAKDSLEIPR